MSYMTPSEEVHQAKVKELMPDKMFKDKLQQCHRLPEDKDKFRMITNVADQYLLTPPQAAKFLNAFNAFGKAVECAAEIQDKTSDEDGFIHEALMICKYPEGKCLFFLSFFFFFFL